MLSIDLKSRLRSKPFIVAMVSAIVLLIQQCGFKDVIPSNYGDVLSTVLTILTMLGIVVDTSTPGISDNIVTAPLQASNSVTQVSATSDDSQSATVAPVEDASTSASDSASTQVTDDVAALKAQIATLTDANTGLTNTNATLTSDNINLTNTNLSLSTANGSLTSQLTGIKNAAAAAVNNSSNATVTVAQV